MRGKPLYPFAITAALGILLVVILSFVGINIGPEYADNEENNNVNEEQAQQEEEDDPLELGEDVYEGQCASCHGGDLEGGTGPALDEGQYDEDEILTAIEEGPGEMPADLVDGEEADAVTEFILEQE